MNADAIDRAGRAIVEARTLLDRPAGADRAAPIKVLGASALAAVAAVLMAGAFILGPGVTVDELAVAERAR
ncbi:hypothetical protein [Brevundimonas sp.]|uniref:hypothetical protein n=1 Tax=Brevundimonas sp. TaxID=1871086 RepID=UPI0026296801|nr:hypothetical protein [Brevundimonas sp.]